MDWWMIEYDNKNFDSHKFLDAVQNALAPLFIAAGGGPAGAGVFHPVRLARDNKERLYFNSKAAGIPGVHELLSQYRVKECEKLSEWVGVFVGNHAEPFNNPWDSKR
jgi:hypothetical protein